MTDKEFGKLVKDISAILKKVVVDSADSPNALELYKFLQKTHNTALTFDKTHSSYKNYLELTMKPKKVKDAKEDEEGEKKKPAKDTTAADSDGKKKKKADAPLDDEAKKPAKKAKAS